VAAGTPCGDDQNACTFDQCTGTGTCGHPHRPDFSATCDDGNACTSNDVCVDGVCSGLVKVAGCCQTDDECADAYACTEDRCTSNACLHVPVDDRCGTGTECQAPACAPGETGADTDGCVLRAANEVGYCTEDHDPCTVDLCRTGSCAHEDDGSGPRCPALDDPYLTLQALLDRTGETRALLTEAEKTGCAALASGCQIVGGARSPVPRLAEFLDAARSDLETASLTLAGRIGPPLGATRDPVVRARLALGLIAPTRARLRTYLLTIGQLRRQKLLGRTFAKQLQAQARTLVGGTGQVQKRLRRITKRRETFAR
jgi:hypothetical protein